MKFKLFLNDLKYSLSFVKLSDYDDLKRSFDYQVTECSKKEAEIKKLKKEQKDLENYRAVRELELQEQNRKNISIIDKLKEEKTILHMKIKSFSGKIGGLTSSNSRLNQELTKINNELEIAKKELSKRPRTNLQSLINYHENKK